MKKHLLILIVLGVTSFFLINLSCNKDADIPEIIHEPEWVKLADYNFKVTKEVVFGNTPEGFRLDLYFEGPFSGDSINGVMSGIDYYTVRENEPDLINAHATIITDDSALITVYITGFFYDDGSIQDEIVRFESGFPKYSWLNDRLLTGHGLKMPDTSYSLEYYYAK